MLVDWRAPQFFIFHYIVRWTVMCISVFNLFFQLISSWVLVLVATEANSRFILPVALVYTWRHLQIHTKVRKFFNKTNYAESSIIQFSPIFCHKHTKARMEIYRLKTKDLIWNRNICCWCQASRVCYVSIESTLKKSNK